MKKRITIIIACVAFFLGAVIGSSVASRIWSRIVESQTVTSSMYNVSTVYAPLKLLKEGQTEKATDILKVELDSAMQNLELMSETLNRPDMLTNSSVVGAKRLR